MPRRTCLAALAVCLCQPALSAPPGIWATSWAVPPFHAYPGTEFGGLSTREILHATQGGSQVRVRFTNFYGGVPLTIGAANIAVPTGADTIDPTTVTALSFAGAASVTIPVGAMTVSDPVAFTLAPNSNYAISLYTPNATGPATSHDVSTHYAYAATGNQIGQATMTGDFSLGTAVFFVSGLDVAAGQTAGIVALGDSITDGYGSTFGTDTNWPDDLSLRLAAKFGNTRAVANAGISGDQLLQDFSPGFLQGGLARLDRDVLALPGTKEVILALGINDIGQAGTNAYPAASDVIAGMQQLIDRAHERGLTVYGATITPALNSSYYNSVFESKRQAINSFVRSGAFDRLVDFDLAVRNPYNNAELLPAYDSGDHLHPNSAGYQAMANIYPLGK